MGLFPLTPLVEQLSRLPGVGPKSAQRLAFFFLSLPKGDVQRFSDTLTDVRNRIRYCDRCFNISFDLLCTICQEFERDASVLCVVAEPSDILSIERTGVYKGLYHVLGGLISPLDGIHPEALRLAELKERVASGGVTEVILAINSTIEGDTTSLYLSKFLATCDVRLAKLAHGLPMGADIDYADDLTLQKAIQGRISMEESHS